MKYTSEEILTVAEAMLILREKGDISLEDIFKAIGEKPLTAIKIWKKLKGLSLKEAKEQVEDFLEYHGTLEYKIKGVIRDFKSSSITTISKENVISILKGILSSPDIFKSEQE